MLIHRFNATAAIPPCFEINSYGDRRAYARATSSGRLHTSGFLAAMLFLFVSVPAFAQGEDSQPWDRDLQVISTMLSGQFSNANQAYFDQRVDRPVKHERINVVVTDAGDGIFEARVEYDDSVRLQRWQLTADDARRAVRMSVLGVEDNTAKGCDVYWVREAGQFTAEAADACDEGMPIGFALSEDQLWMRFAQSTDHFQMHRARRFQCYADMPGVGGGRDIEYKRFDGFEITDQGGEFWFTAVDGRELGASLLSVDWPINNLNGIFTRNSLVLYVNERTAEGQKEISYTFTEPTAERIGINLKWLLVNCFIESNEVATPSM